MTTVCLCSRKENTFPSCDREFSASHCRNSTMAKTIYSPAMDKNIVNICVWLCNKISLSFYKINAVKKSWQFSRIHMVYYFNIWNYFKHLVSNLLISLPLLLCQHWTISENYVQHKLSVKNSGRKLPSRRMKKAHCLLVLLRDPLFTKPPLILWLSCSHNSKGLKARKTVCLYVIREVGTGQHWA